MHCKVNIPIPIVYDDQTSWTVGSVWRPEQLANSDKRYIAILLENRGAYERFQERQIQKELLSSSHQIQQVCNPI